MIVVLLENPSRICHRRCFAKKLFLKIYKIFTGKHVLESVLNFIKKRLQHRCLPVKFTRFLITLILKNICERLLLTKPNRNPDFHGDMVFCIITINC